MNEYDLKNFEIHVAGVGKEYFQPIEVNESDTFREKGLHISVSEGFSAPEITKVIISIGANVIAGLSVYYIAKLFDKIFSAKEKAKKEGQEFEISVSISEKVIIRNVENIVEIEKALDIVVKK